MNIFSEGGDVCCYKKNDLEAIAMVGAFHCKQRHNHLTGPFKELTIVKQQYYLKY